jgi:outer membrane PBP1 activator LpoA protein
MDLGKKVVKHRRGAALRGWAMLLGVLVLLGGCGGDFGNVRRGPAVDAPTAAALYEQGEFDQAAQAYLRLARTDRGQRASYRLRAAQAWREEGQWSEARSAMEEIRRRDLDREEAILLDLLHAEMALADGDVQSASDLLVMDTERVPADLRPRLLELRARSFAASGAWVDAARERVMLDPLLGAMDQSDNAREIGALLEQLDPQDRSDLLRQLERDDPLYPWLLKRTPISSGGNASYAAELGAAPVLDASIAGLDPIQIPGADFRKLALLLPSSGDLAGAAQVIRDGVLAGYFSDPGRRPLVQVYDSGNSPEEAVAAYERALAEGADRVLGPFPREQVTALFRHGTRVPTLALNYAEAPALPPPGSLQFALLPEEEALAVAEYMIERGMRSVTALVPEDDFGRRTLDAFRSRFVALGGEVRDPQFFSPQLTDNSTAIRRALSAQRQAQAGADGRFVGGLDGIFLAARPAQARLLMPQLRVQDPLGLPIFATSHLYGGAPSSQDQDLNGIEFVDAPWLYADVGNFPPRQQVASLSALQGPAVRLFAFGLDAWHLVSRIEWLEDHPRQVLEGATGRLAADGRGSIRRQGVWRKFVDGTPEPVE